MKASVVIASGLGNAIMIIPAINALKKKGYTVDGIFTSPFRCEELFEESDLFDQKIVLDTKSQIVKFGVKHHRDYKLVVLDQFACTKRHFWLAKQIGKKIVAQTDDIRSIKKKIEYLPFIIEQHGILNNIDLLKSHVRTKVLDMRFLPKKDQQDYLVFQPGSGNNKTPWKSWPLDNWLKVLRKIGHPIKVIGDNNERGLISQIEEAQLEQCEVLIGKQSIPEMVDTIQRAKLYLGHDSGPMHIAVACDVPTFVVWGGSPKTVYAYDELFPDNNKVIQGVATRYSPKTIDGLDPDKVRAELKLFLNEL